MSGCVTLVSCYVLRRKRSGSASDEDDALAACEYQVWIISQVYCGPDGSLHSCCSSQGSCGRQCSRGSERAPPQGSGRGGGGPYHGRSLEVSRLYPAAGARPRRGFTGHAEGTGWYGGGQHGCSSGRSHSGSRIQREVAAAFMLEPVLRPVTQALHGLEVVGIVIALATGQPHLSILCAKPLLHDQVGSGLADAFERAMRPEEAASEDDAADTVTADTAQAELAGEPGAAERTRQDPQKHAQGSARQVLLDTCRDDDPSLLGGSADQDDARPRTSPTARLHLPYSDQVRLKRYSPSA